MTHFLSLLILVALTIQGTLATAATLPPSRNPEYRPGSYFPRTGLEWSELELNSVYSLTEPIYYTDSRRNNYLLYPANSPFRFNQLIPIPQIRTIYYEFIHQNCPYPNLKLDVFIFKNVAITVEPGCITGIYLETRDYYSPSFWKLISAGQQRRR